jgi:hypothetical protein
LFIPYGTIPVACPDLATTRIRKNPTLGLVTRESEGSYRDEWRLDHDRADRQKPDLALCLSIHVGPNSQIYGSIPTYWKNGTLELASAGI